MYVALNGAGKVVRVDPVSGNQCDIATGMHDAVLGALRRRRRMGPDGVVRHQF